MTPPADDFPCNQFVELVTEYLEGALSSDEAGGSTNISRSVEDATACSSSSGRSSA